MPAPLVLATRSADKVRELRDLFNGSGHSVVTLDELRIEPTADEEFLESAHTFEENALAKARFFSRLLDRAVVADDSGLEVEALGGQPGVLSKRWSGGSDLTAKALDQANNSRLIAELSRVSGGNRRARYVCAAALCDGNREVTFRGTTTGWILPEPSGEHGFGYDPYFFSDELGKTFGDASLEEKQRVSHRARAFRAMLAALDGFG
jgi:XTP/dITP diphosphohydrolase